MTTFVESVIQQYPDLIKDEAFERAQLATRFLMSAACDLVRSTRDEARTFETDARFAIAVTAVAENTSDPDAPYDERISYIGGAALSLARAEIFDEQVVPGAIAPKADDIKQLTRLGYGKIVNRKGKFIPKTNPVNALEVLECLYREQLEFQMDS
jgi:hypothetical protein